MTATLEIEGLSVSFRQASGKPKLVVHEVDLSLHPARILGLAGESGCGKSTTALAAIGFPIPGTIRSGQSRLTGIDLLSLTGTQLREVWGRRIGYVAQDAVLALDPLQRIGRALAEPLALHLGFEGSALHRRMIELLDGVGLAADALTRYPHEFSGGQRQRIALAIAIACEPEVLVLDEPTTGLDVTTQAQIAHLIADVVRGLGTAAVAISHDLALLATLCDEIAIMYGGEIVERAAARTIYDAPRHPYTAALIDAVPRIDDDAPMVGISGMPPPAVVADACSFAERCHYVQERCHSGAPVLATVADGHLCRCVRAEELGRIPSVRRHATRSAAVSAEPVPQLVIRGLTCSYGRRGPVAVSDLSLELAAGETLAVVGESGSGKSTLLRAVAGLHVPDDGTIDFRGTPLPARAVDRKRELCRSIQIVFQDPHSSLNPRHTIAQLIGRSLRLFHPELPRGGVPARVRELLAEVRLDPGLMNRRPHQLSGGQLQRVALARAFAADPEVILCDEVVSALDVSVQASILELLGRLAGDRATSLLFVTHDLAVARSIADRVCVMRDGVVCETGPIGEVFAAPAAEYTRTLLASVPQPAMAFERDGPA